MNIWEILLLVLLVPMVIAGCASVCIFLWGLFGALKELFWDS